MSMWWLIRLAICYNIGIESLGRRPSGLMPVFDI